MRSADEPAGAAQAAGDAAPSDARSSSGQRTLAEAQAAFDARKAGFFRANSLRASENGGKVVVTFTVTPEGEVVECRIVSSDFRDSAFNAAVVAEVWRLRLERRDVAEFTYSAYPIVFSPRAEQQAALAASGGLAAYPEPAPVAVPVAAPVLVPPAPVAPAPVDAVPVVIAAAAPPVEPPPPPATSPPDPRAPRTTAEVQQAFGANMDAFKQIQQRHGAKLRGTIVASFTIAPGGEVQDVRIVSSDFDNARLHSDVQAEVGRIRLGRIADKSYTYRDYPIVFVPSPDSP